MQLIFGVNGIDIGLGTLHGRPIIGAQRGRGRCFASSLPGVRNSVLSSSSSLTTVNDDAIHNNCDKVLKKVLDGSEVEAFSSDLTSFTSANTEDILTPQSTSSNATFNGSAATTSLSNINAADHVFDPFQLLYIDSTSAAPQTTNTQPIERSAKPFVEAASSNLLLDDENNSTLTEKSDRTTTAKSPENDVEKIVEDLAEAQPARSESASAQFSSKETTHSTVEENGDQPMKASTFSDTATDSVPKTSWSGRAGASDTASAPQFKNSGRGGGFSADGNSSGFNRGGSNGFARGGRGFDFNTIGDRSRNENDGQSITTTSQPNWNKPGEGRGGNFGNPGFSNREGSSAFGSQDIGSERRGFNEHGDRGGRGFGSNDHGNEGRSGRGSGFTRGGFNTENRNFDGITERNGGGRGRGFSRGNGFRSSDHFGEGGGRGGRGDFGDKSSTNEQNRGFGFGRGGFSRGGFNDQGRDSGDALRDQGLNRRNGSRRGGFSDTNGCNDFGDKNTSEDRVGNRKKSGFGANPHKDTPADAEAREERTKERDAWTMRKERAFASMPRKSDKEDSVDVGYVPPIRPVYDIFEEDHCNEENYRCIAVDDEDISINENDKEIAVSIQSNVTQRIIDTWQDANLEPKLLQNILASKYLRPRKIQANAIPYILEGIDVKAHAETGSGKTAAFMVPIINQVMKMDRKRAPLSCPTPFALIIEPTRELCDQVWGQGRKLAYETGLTVARAYGHFDRQLNLKELMMGCDILCGTPGRLADYACNALINLTKIKFLVLDEADRLLECSFRPQLEAIIFSPRFPDVDQRQTLLFSATFPHEVVEFCNEVLKKENLFLSIKKKDEDPERANSKIMQHFFEVNNDQKKDLLVEILQGRNDYPVPKEIRRTLVFVRRKCDADLIALYLSQDEMNIPATTINSDRSQAQRDEALAQFRCNKIKVLVSTDVCARGIDVKDLDHVINYDMPLDHVTYIHRIGRTGRLKLGFATSFIDKTNPQDVDLVPHLVQIIRNAGQSPPEFMLKLIESRPDGITSYRNGFSSSRNIASSFGTGQPKNAERSTIMPIPVPFKPASQAPLFSDNQEKA